ncbi:MAG: guanylate kinase [Prevotella sp.]|jgi:guanylate kinase|nr:guanylate kinase [Prevotella sp.]
MKPIIIAIVGPSGAGKTLATQILKRNLGIPDIVSYTTRPMRAGETNGVEHHFVSEEEMPDKLEMMAYTYYGGYHYWATFSQVPNDSLCAYVVDEKGLKDLIYANFIEIYAVYIDRNTERIAESVIKERIERDANRIQVNDLLYKYVIENNGTVEEFEEKLLLMIESILI